MWHAKVKDLQISHLKRYLNKYYSNSVKSTRASISQTPNVTSLEESEKGVKIDVSSTMPDINFRPVTEIIKTSSYLTTPNIKPEGAMIDSRSSVSFDDIPGPQSLRMISKFWGTIPVMGTELAVSVIQSLLSGGKFFGGVLSWGGNTRFFKKFFDVYGPVVRLHGPFGSDVVLLSRPEHACAVFKNEGPYPVRCCLDSVEKYRLEYRRYRHAGPFLMHGPEWEDIRKTIEQSLQISLDQQCSQIENICDEFIERICTIRNKQDEVPSNFQNEIYKWCLECLCFVTLNKKLGFLDPCGLSATSDPGRLLSGLTGATEGIRKCEYGFHLWKFMETRAWKLLVRNCDMIDSVLSKHIQRGLTSLQEKKEKNAPMEKVSLLELLLLKEGIVAEDAMTVLLDMFLIGVNATAHTIAFLFYHLARNPRCQIKLYEEIKSQGSYLSKNDLKNMPYLQACIKESLRLDPPIPILSRLLNNDLVIDHYLIPKGTRILFASHLNTSREEYFEDARKFKPERWLTNELGGFGNEFQAFASLPFGHGHRSCWAKEMVEMEIAMLLVKMCRRFRIEYNYGDIESSNELLASPNKPLKYRFVNRV